VSVSSEPELAAPSAIPPPRSKFHNPLTAAELEQIAELRLNGWSAPRIARRLKRDHSTIYAALQRPHARELLEQALVPAAKSWIATLKTAPKRSNHLPAKDLLLHLGVIKPILAENTPQIAISVGLVLNTADVSHNATLDAKTEKP